MKKRYITATVGLAISLLYIIADLTGHLPSSKIDAFTEFGLRSLFVSEGGQTTAHWSQYDRQTFSCVFESKEYGHYCGIDIRVGDGREYGEDLSEFTHLQLKFVLQGDGSYVRINFRNAFDDISVAPDGKQMDILKPIKEGLNEFFIPLDSFTIPQYWLDKHPDLGESYLNTERDNVTHMGLFFEEPNVIGAHEFRIEEFVVVNKWQNLLNKIAYILFPVTLLTTALMLTIRYINSRPQPAPIDPKSKGDIRLECEELLKTQTSELDVYDLTSGLLSHDITVVLLKTYAEKYYLSNIIVLAISLNKYDAVKTQFGMEVAKEYRLAASMAVKSRINKQGVACSWNESKFIVLLPQVMAPHIRKIIESIHREAISGTFSRHSLHVDLSVDVSSISSPEDIQTAFDDTEKDV